ncbi:hypothetical protein CP8484711_0838B, partial [Chlamydia psittaci 84-8471/1]
EHPVTKLTARPIVIAVFTVVVTANAEQIPKIAIRGWLLFQRGSRK